MKLRDRAKNLSRDVQDVVREFVRDLGRERGLHAFARQTGVSPRRARTLYEGRSLSVRAEEFFAAVDARAAHARVRAARLRLELAHLEAMERTDHAFDQGNPGTATLCAGGCSDASGRTNDGAARANAPAARLAGEDRGSDAGAIPNAPPAGAVI